MTNSPGPTEDFYDDLRTLPLLVKAAWFEAQALPGAADEVFDRMSREVRRIAGVAIMHLRQTSAEAEKRWNAAEKATFAAERRIGRALAGIAGGQLGDAFDPRGNFVYCLWGSDTDIPLYVGMSTNILARLGTHLNDAEKRRRVERVTLIRCKTDRQMRQAEVRLIGEYQPPLNVVGIRPVGAA